MHIYIYIYIKTVELSGCKNIFPSNLLVMSSLPIRPAFISKEYRIMFYTDYNSTNQKIFFQNHCVILFCDILKTEQRKK